MKKQLLVLHLAIGLLFPLTNASAQMGGEMAISGSPAYEMAARPLRSAPPRSYNFSKAVLSDIMRLMAEDAGIGFFGLPEGADSTDRLVTFTIKASPFSALETLAKANGVSLIYDSGIWYLRPANDGELIGRIYQINYNAQEQVKKNGQSGGGLSSNSASSGASGGGSAGLNLQGAPDFFVTEPSQLLEDIRAIVDLPTTGGSATIAPTASVDNVNQFSLRGFQSQPSLVPNSPISTGPQIGGAAAAAGNSSSSKVIWNSDSNSLYVVATRQQHQWIEAYLAAADKPQPMVAIEVKFLETSKNPRSELGVSWNGSISANDTDSFSAQFNPQGDSTTGILSSLPVAVLNYKQVSMTLRALYEDRRTRSVSYPRMMTLDNREVSFRSVINQPVLGSSSSASLGAGATQTSAIEYIPIGTVINILPKIMSGCKVTLNVSVTVSDIIGTEYINGNPFPIATSRVYTAPLTVQSGYTVAISGLDAAKSENGEAGIPILGRLPVIGAAFRSRTKDANRQHLMMLITPVVLNSHTTGVTTQPMSREPASVSYPINSGGKAQVCASNCESTPSYNRPRQSSQRLVAQPLDSSSSSDLASTRKSSQTFGKKETTTSTMASKPKEATVTSSSVGSTASSLSASTSTTTAPKTTSTPVEVAPKVASTTSSTVAKPAATTTASTSPDNSTKLSQIQTKMKDLESKLKKIPQDESRLSPDDGQTVKNVFEESRQLLTEIDTLRGDKTAPLEGDLGSVWWSLIQLKTDAFKMSKRSPESLAINIDGSDSGNQ